MTSKNGNGHNGKSHTGTACAEAPPAPKSASTAKTPSRFSEFFARFAQATSYITGRPVAFLLAVLVVVVWVASGPLFHFSDTWQLVINTGTTIVTFLMVFLIQNSQNRDTLALQVKLSELILAMKTAENRFAAIETLPDEELEALHEECRERAEHVRGAIEARRSKPPNEKIANGKRSSSARASHAKAR